jgi:hypothetical protein
MFRQTVTRLAYGAAAAGAICALGTSAAMAAPNQGWSPPSKPVPGALTNNAPALSTVTFPSPVGQGLLVAWRGRGVAGHIFYKYRTSRHQRWSHTGVLSGALTSSAPAVAAYTDPLGRSAVLVTWTGHADKHIWYAQGETRADGTISFSAPRVLPNWIAYSRSYAAPAVFFPDHRNVVMIGWRGPYNHVRYLIGVPAGRGFRWSQSHVIPGNPPTPASAHCTKAPCTSATPAITERTTGTSSGLIYVFWKQRGTTDVFYAATADDHATIWRHLTWTGPVQVPGAHTFGAPAASVPTLNAIGPLLLAYKAPYSTLVRYQTLTSTGWSGYSVVPGARTAVAPALVRNVLATTTPGTIGNIVLHVYG